MIQSSKCFPHASKMHTLTNNRVISIVMETALILNFIHNMFNIRDIETITCIILIICLFDGV